MGLARKGVTPADNLPDRRLGSTQPNPGCIKEDKGMIHQPRGARKQ